MSKHGFDDYSHVLRMAGLFALGIVAFLVFRWVMVPSDFGRLGHYRFGALEANRTRAIAFAGQAACVDCHSDVATLRATGAHKGVHCEACHGALAAHVAAISNGTISKPDRPNPRTLCLRCHSPNASKPQAFPRIDPKEHAPEGPCTECHKAHAPKIS
jgi:hypothetical protein